MDESLANQFEQGCSKSERIEAILNELDQSEKNAKCEKRQHKRFRYRHHSTKIKILDPSRIGGRVFFVSIRNISSFGASCIHTGFLYPKTQCVVELRKPDGQSERIGGIIRRCQYVGQGLHEVGVEFESEITVSEFVDDTKCLTVLVVEDDREMQRLIRYYLTSLGIDSFEVNDGARGLTAAIQNSYDVILMDLEMPVMDGFTAISKLRANDYDGIIAAVTGLQHPSAKERALIAGADTVVEKPLLRSTIETFFNMISGAPALSEFSSDIAMRDQLRRFIGAIPATVRMIEEALQNIDSEDSQLLDQLCREFRYSSAAHGFPDLSSNAADIQTAIAFKLEKSAVKTAINTLVANCYRTWLFNRKMAIAPVIVESNL